MLRREQAAKDAYRSVLRRLERRELGDGDAVLLNARAATVATLEPWLWPMRCNRPPWGKKLSLTAQLNSLGHPQPVQLHVRFGFRGSQQGVQDY